MPVIPFQEHTPLINPTAFIAPDAWIIGHVAIGQQSSIFFNVVIRGDIQKITIGSGTNLQEHVLVHSSHGMDAVTIGNEVTIGHRAIIHGCTIQDYALIGMGATILDNAVIGAYSIIGAHTLIPKGIQIPPRSLVMGTPGKIVRQVSDQEMEELRQSAKSYQELGALYRQQLAAGINN